MTRHGLDSRLVLRLSLLASLLLAVACGDDDSGNAMGGDGGPDGSVNDQSDGDMTHEPTSRDDAGIPLSTIEPDSTTACRIDVDCADDLHCFQGACVFECKEDGDCHDGDTCSKRRQCESAAQDGIGTSAHPATPEVVPGVHFLDQPNPVVRVQPGQETVKIHLQTNEKVPDGVIGYTVETYSHSTREAHPPLQVFRALGSDSFDVEVPTTTANPDSDERGIVEVQVESSVGSFRTRLQPQPPTTGRYGGAVTVARFGALGLPIDFEILTDPADATPEDADHVYLVVPVAPGNVFSPIAPDPTSAVDAVSIELKSTSGKWIGTTRSSFAFAADSMLARYADNVIRGLRFQLQFDGDIVSGTVRDTWEGLYDARTADGVASQSTVVFDGKLETRRLGAARALADLPTPAKQVTTDAAARDLPDVTAACPDAQFTVADYVDANSETFTCSGLTSAAAFTAASAAAQASCATAVADTSLAKGNTTAALITAFLNGDTSVTGTESFADFMARCAAGKNGACRPAAEVLCGRALTAHAIATQAAPDASFGYLFDAYQRVTREAFLGRQLAAYQSDTDTRLEWLRSQSYPAVVTSQVRDLNKRLIDDWRTSVLDAHFGAISGQFDEAGLSVLAREMQGQALIDARQLLLSEMTQSWRAGMDAMTLAARRWNEVYQDTESRAEGATFVSARAFDLYVLGGVVDQLNVASGAAYASAALAGGFSSMLDGLRHLALPFSALVFERDAEVVLSRSLDPLSTDDTLLSDIRKAATADLDRATSSVNGILDRAQKMAVDEKLLRDDLKNQVDAAFDELVSLCGFPEGCDNGDRERPECWPRVKAGECGFGTEVDNMGTAEVPKLTVKVVDYTPSANVSDGGEAILKVVQASDALDGARSALADYMSVTEHMIQSDDALEKTYEDNLDAAHDSSQEISDLFGEILDGQDEYDRSLGDWYDELVKQREDALQERRDSAMKLRTMRSMGREQDIRLLRASTALSQGADSLNAAAERAEKVTEIGVDGSPKGADDFWAPARLAFRMTEYGVTSGMNVVAEGLKVAASVIDVEREAAAELNEENLANTELMNELDEAKREDEIANYESMIDKEKEKGNIWEQKRRDAIEKLKGQLELDREIDRDYGVLVDHRDAEFARIVGEKDREIQTHQAEFTVQQRQTEYLHVVQRAQLLDGRLRNLVAQRDQLNLNLGSPAVVFSWANQLEQAESRLDRAKDKLMDWVVALEYLAVRPFMDARLQIMLARNTYQLSQIAASLDEIQSRCGGAINTNTSEISVRDDVLRLDSNLKDGVTGKELTPAQTFREILERGSIPVDKRIRFSSDATIGDVASHNGILAATFDLSLSDFANLEASCNAKVKEVAIELVGRDLGRAEPTVALAYDGASSVRSCQPDIEDIVDSIGRDATAFGAVTVFNAAGRVLAPVAGVNEYGAVNQTLVGLPLASQYTVIIDPTLGQNASIDWSKLEDVKIKITYGYQDFYPSGQCH